MKGYGQSNKWKQSWDSFPSGMSLLHTRISSGCVHGNMHMQMNWGQRAQTCLRYRQCLTCIFKLICQAHESVRADTFTYEHGCRGAGPDLGWQVLCHCPWVGVEGRSHNVTEIRAERCLSFTVNLGWHGIFLSLSPVYWGQQLCGNIWLYAQMTVYAFTGTFSCFALPHLLAQQYFCSLLLELIRGTLVILYQLQ